MHLVSENVSEKAFCHFLLFNVFVNDWFLWKQISNEKHLRSKENSVEVVNNFTIYESICWYNYIDYRQRPLPEC